ncbi:unnamed protein product [Pylaiella littoralis]
MGNISGSSSSSGDVRSISATEVLELVAREEAQRGTTCPRVLADQPTPGEGELSSRLLALGVDMGEASVADATRCWQLVAEQGFWRDHYDWHPGKKRVKAWLFVHQKFRASAESIVEAAEAMQTGITGGCEASKTDKASRKVESSFKSLLGKVDKHSDFEDTQLFRFFEENTPEIAGQISALEADHAENQLETGARECLTTLRSAPTTAGGVSGGADVAAAAAAVDALKAYVASLKGHLDREERAIVGPWLNLDPEMYLKYRTYLVGKYRLVY